MYFSVIYREMIQQLMGVLNLPLNLPPDPSPKNPVFHIMLKLIDDILAQQREKGVQNGPANVEDIYTLPSREATPSTSMP